MTRFVARLANCGLLLSGHFGTCSTGVLTTLLPEVDDHPIVQRELYSLGRSQT